ncbi:hypothetical protein EON66_06935 [archaeon]|nr:MAG: hypothetical protein EON66_06935 [archaeon]
MSYFYGAAGTFPPPPTGAEAGGVRLDAEAAEAIDLPALPSKPRQHAVASGGPLAPSSGAARSWSKVASKYTPPQATPLWQKHAPPASTVPTTLPETSSAASSAARTSTVRSSIPLCSFFLSGGCFRGETCRFRHEIAAPEAIAFFEAAIAQARDGESTPVTVPADVDAQTRAEPQAAAADVAAGETPGSTQSADAEGGTKACPLTTSDASPATVESMQAALSALMTPDGALDASAARSVLTSLAQAQLHADTMTHASSTRAGAATSSGAGGTDAHAHDDGLSKVGQPSDTEEAMFAAASAAWQAMSLMERDTLLGSVVAAGLVHDLEEADVALTIAERNASTDVTCSICLERVMDESGRRFGLLTGCSHAFCLDCIRTWRARIDMPPETVRACPICRKLSFFIVPCDRYVTDAGRKAVINEQYHSQQRAIPCRNFNYGKGECPFGSSCWYAHLNPDGTPAEMPKHSLRLDAEGNVSVARNYKLSELLAGLM